MHVFVTGAGGGVGRAIALRFARDGYSVTVAGRTRSTLEATAALITQSGRGAHPLVCDVTSRQQVDQSVLAAEQQLGAIDVLVNNAGISDSAPFACMDDELWKRTIAVNLDGTYHCMRAVTPGMFARRSGRIINIASSAGKVGYPYTAAYVASKHGVLGLTRSVAIEAASRGVTVNAICPGWIASDMTARSVARIVARTGKTDSEARTILEAMNPQGRLIEPEEVAEVAAFLASPDGAGTNGEAIDI
ncbi:MAG: SDR family oxidoreductase [Acidobacteriota bacterium]|nr:SDR family oxidoreductase [Acidobacteriota bacterium]MDQ3421166.1 SDR family oxidoreductase [Acidobacteriota bacterium]